MTLIDPLSEQIWATHVTPVLPGRLVDQLLDLVHVGDTGLAADRTPDCGRVEQVLFRPDVGLDDIDSLTDVNQTRPVLGVQSL